MTFLPVFTPQASACGDRAATLAAVLFKVFEVAFGYLPIAPKLKSVGECSFAEISPHAVGAKI